MLGKPIILLALPALLRAMEGQITYQIMNNKRHLDAESLIKRLRA
jgi:hypothetical protein